MQATKEEIVTVNLSMTKEEARALYVIALTMAGAGPYRAITNSICSALCEHVGGRPKNEELTAVSNIQIIT